MMEIIQKTDSLMVLKDSQQQSSLWKGAILVIAGIALIVFPGIYVPLPIWVPLLLIAIGVAVIVLGKDTIATFDKGQSKFVLEKQSLIGNERKELPFDQIKELQFGQSIQTSHSSKGGTHTHFTSKLILIPKAEKEIVIASSSRSGHGVWLFAQSQGATNEERMGSEISEFTKIPFKTFKPPSVTEVITSLQTGVPPGMEKVPLEKVEKPPAP